MCASQAPAPAGEGGAVPAGRSVGALPFARPTLEDYNPALLLSTVPARGPAPASPSRVEVDFKNVPKGVEIRRRSESGTADLSLGVSYATR